MAKVLMIDDDSALCTVYETAFKQAGFEIITCYTGRGGLEAVKTGKPNIILLDQIISDMNGNDVLKTLKSDPLTKSIPVAMLSNFGQNELVQEAINSGAEDYILKYQIEPQDVINKVREILKNNENIIAPAVS